MEEKQRRRTFTIEQKSAILREHFVDKMSVPDVCEKHNLQPSFSTFGSGRFFDNVEAALDKGNGRRKRAVDDKNATHLKQMARHEEKLAKKDAVIADISEEHFNLKKALGEP